MDSTLYNGQCRDCGAPLIDCKCHKEGKMDTRTLEQVIMDASGKSAAEAKGYSAVVGCDSVEAKIIAAAVREWMESQKCAQATHAEEPKERTLEESLEMLRTQREKASKYDALRERFPFWLGDEFWTYLQGAIRKWSVCEVWIGGGEILCKGVANGKQSPVYRMHECHPTADACKAAIPVEAGEK
jgi:hypothetical protein